jgi:hypothetical protein
MPAENASSDLFHTEFAHLPNKHLPLKTIPVESRAMTFYKATFAWLLISVAIGWGLYRTVAPENPSFTPILMVTLGFILLVAFTGCKVDEPEHH